MVTKNDTSNIRDAIIATIKTIYDPEIPIDIYELGLIYGIDVDKDVNVIITMTLTSPNCPVADSLPKEVEDKVRAMKNVKSVKLELTFEPPWNMENMSEAAQLELGFI